MVTSPDSELSSSAHSAALPVFSSLTLIRSQECGLTHSNSFTVPCSVMVFSASNMAKEWFASADVAHAAAATAARLATFRFIGVSPNDLANGRYFEYYI